MAVGEGTPQGKGSPLRTWLRSLGAAGEPGSQVGMAGEC